MTRRYSRRHDVYDAGKQAFQKARRQGLVETWDRACPFHDGPERDEFRDGWLDELITKYDGGPQRPPV
jgi:hypothetical protein